MRVNIEWLRTFCLSLPGVKEEVKWGNDLCFTVGKKMFCVTGLESEFQFSFKVSDEEFDELSNRSGFVPAPYMARAHWVLLTEPSRLSKKEAENYIGASYQMIFDKLTRKEKEKISGQKTAPTSKAKAGKK